MPPNQHRYGSIPLITCTVDEERQEEEPTSAPVLAVVDIRSTPPSKESHCLSSSAGLFAFLGGGLCFLLLWLAHCTSDSNHHGIRTKGTTTTTTTSDVDEDTTSPITHQHRDIERFYTEQLIDHFGEHDDSSTTQKKTYAQRYFEDSTHFRGPGYPIFVVMGGEAPIDGIIYPWVSRSLAATHGALTVCIEHRFYGASQPVDPAVVTNQDLHTLLHPRQALADAAYFVRHLQRSLGCGPRGTLEYCPVLALGGGYPGFLAVLMRTVYSQVVDFGWASSAPLHFYSHAVGDAAYYDKITSVAEAYSPGCAPAVKETLGELQTFVSSQKSTLQEAADLGICTDTLPACIDNLDTLHQEVIMVVAARFADNNMGFYPPTSGQPFVQGCKIFQRGDLTPHERVSAFLRMSKGFEECFDMVSELPPSPGGTISASDWSGVGGEYEGLIWDYQSCTLVPECSLSPQSMFPARQSTLEWLTEHCQRRFDYTPHPQALVGEFGFDDLSQDSHIIFTNGFNDGWYALSVTQNLSDTIRAFNFENGAHHSDLTLVGATDQDTPDIVQGHKQVTELIGTWLDEIMSQGEG